MDGPAKGELAMGELARGGLAKGELSKYKGIKKEEVCCL